MLAGLALALDDDDLELGIYVSLNKGPLNSEATQPPPR